MGMPQYLAMTAAEFTAYLPQKNAAWMACHFSPSHHGLSNLPVELPTGALLILDDSTPLEAHDPEIVKAQLAECVTRLQCAGVLLDFQRPDCGQAGELAAGLSEALPCPVAVSHLYAAELSCPVFLPPCPLHCSLKSHLAPWTGRSAWLEIALEVQTMVLTKDGCRVKIGGRIPESGFEEETLHCHYKAEVLEDAVRFTLWRTREDLERMLEEAEKLGVACAVGLWQELWEK